MTAKQKCNTVMLGVMNEVNAIVGEWDLKILQGQIDLLISV